MKPLPFRTCLCATCSDGIAALKRLEDLVRSQSCLHHIGGEQQAAARLQAEVLVRYLRKEYLQVLRTHE